MEKLINRDAYLSRLIDKKENGLIKVITGIRRCGKSYLLFYLFRDYLIESGIKEEQIISIALDDDICEQYRNPDELTELTDDLCSSIGSLTNAKKIADTLGTVKNIKVSTSTIAKYLE